ncbi:T6SS effector BTH_I2691 family protein [Pseudomonas segetis]
MTQPATTPQIKQAQRNQAFDDTPLSHGQCSLMAGEVAIFPVRYALDESPEKGTNQGPNPLPSDWQGGALPSLQTRSYTLRQLRDGWVYVWDSIDKTFHEYEVKGEQFTRHKWTDKQLNQDVRNNPGESLPYLLYPRRSRLRIAFSPVQWTWRICELMRSSTKEQGQWMREVNLPAFCLSGRVANGGPIRALGESLADILPTPKKPTFATTTLPTQAGDDEPAGHFKATFEEALVRGKVPDQDTALFVALDDPLALVEDLNMNLMGRLAEQSLYENQHQHKLQSAQSVIQLCGVDTDALTPASVKDPVQRAGCAKDIYQRLSAEDKATALRNSMSPIAQGMHGMPDTRFIDAQQIAEAAQAAFNSKWGAHISDQQWHATLKDWNSKSKWREDVFFDDVVSFYAETTQQLLRLQAHCQRSEHDLITWLNALKPNAEAVYYDSCNAAQSAELLGLAYAVYVALSGCEAGKEWLLKQGKAPDNLLGMALFNFSPELEAMVKQVSANFAATGSLDDQGQGDGSSPLLDPSSPGDITNVSTRVAELKGVLDTGVLQKTAVYKALSSDAKQAFDTLRLVANDIASEAWHGLSQLLIPAMKEVNAIKLSALQVLISTEISGATQLVKNPNYASEFQAWTRKVIPLNRQKSALQRVLYSPGLAHDKRSARIQLNKLDEELNTLFLQRPLETFAKVQGGGRISLGPDKVQILLSDLGQAEVAAQLRFKALNTAAYSQRAKAWVGQNLGKSLPALLVGLNAWNFFSVSKQAANDGSFSADEWRNMASSAAYTANAMMTFAVAPMWERAAGMAATLDEKVTKVAKASYRAWVGEARAGGSAVAGEFAAFSKALILRTATWAVFGAVACGLEAWQLYKDSQHATSEQERLLIERKMGVVIVMGVVAGFQFGGALAGFFFGFSWVMATPIGIILAVLGAAYLILSMMINNAHREGVRRWLFHCNWGREPNPEWSVETDTGHAAQMNALVETLQQPTLVSRAVEDVHQYSTPYGGGVSVSTPKGFWLQLLLPKLVAGHDVMLQPAMVDTHWFSDDTLRATPAGYSEQFLNGFWADPKTFQTLPTTEGGNTLPADYRYNDEDTHRLWQAWIDTPLRGPVLELEVTYPSEVLQRKDGRGYMLQLAIGTSADQADRQNNAFEAALNKNLVLASNSTQQLTLPVPN